MHRAYIAVEPVDIEEYTLGDDRMACDVLFKNAGNLHATKIRWFITADLDKSAARKDFPHGNGVGNITLAPKGQMRKGTTDKPGMTKTEFAAFRSLVHSQPPDEEDGRGWLFVWGYVTYNDGFRDDRKTEFCIRYSMARATATPARIAVTEARYHEHGNRTDED